MGLRSNLISRPEVEPGSWRIGDRIIPRHLGKWWRSDQQAGAEQELGVDVIESGKSGREDFRKFHIHRTHEREASARGLIGKRVEIR